MTKEEQKKYKEQIGEGKGGPGRVVGPNVDRGGIYFARKVYLSDPWYQQFDDLEGGDDPVPGTFVEYLRNKDGSVYTMHFTLIKHYIESGSVLAELCESLYQELQELQNDVEHYRSIRITTSRFLESLEELRKEFL